LEDILPTFSREVRLVQVDAEDCAKEENVSGVELYIYISG
jgi:hypothetical protein